MKKRSAKHKIALVILAAAVLLAAFIITMPRSLERTMDHGFDPESAQSAHIALSPLEGPTLEITLQEGDSAIGDLVDRLQKYKYSRQFHDGNGSIDLGYMVYIALSDGERWHEFNFYGSHEGIPFVTIEGDPYGISGGQETQQAILDFLLTLPREEQDAA